MSQRCYGKDELVVNYHDACIYGRDLALLESTPKTEWLNDACIHFALTDLQVAHDTTNSASCSGNSLGGTTLFLDPAVVAFLMHQCQDEDDFQDFVAGCRNFDNVHRLVVPINDSLTADHWAIPGAGTHWTLLFMERYHDKNNNNNGIGCAAAAYHMDSVKGSGNLSVAQAVADKIMKASAGAFGSSLDVVVHDCQGVPTQCNGYDCGVHVIAAAQTIAEMIGTCPNDSDRNSVAKYVVELRKRMGNNSSTFCQNLRQQLAIRIRMLAARSK